MCFFKNVDVKMNIFFTLLQKRSALIQNTEKQDKSAFTIEGAASATHNFILSGENGSKQLHLKGTSILASAVSGPTEHLFDKKWVQSEHSATSWNNGG